MCLIRDDFTRMTWLYFLRHKSDVTYTLKLFLASIRADGGPSTVELVRSNDGDKFSNDGEFGDLWRERSIKQELTTVESPHINGLAKRMLGLLEAGSIAASPTVS